VFRPAYNRDAGQPGSHQSNTSSSVEMDNNSEIEQDWLGKTLYVCKTRWTKAKVKVIARFVSGGAFATLFTDEWTSICMLHRMVESHAACSLKIDYHAAPFSHWPCRRNFKMVLFSGECKLKRCPGNDCCGECKTLADYHHAIDYDQDFFDIAQIGNDEDFVVTVVVQEDKLPQLNESHSDVSK
jgi:hypothetical protein